MTLYELVLIAKAGKTIAESASFLTLHKSLMKSCALAVLDNKGVVRSFENLGKRMKRHQQIHSSGNYFSMLFDSSPKVMLSLQNSLKTNEYVIRHTVIKMGDTLPQISDYKDPMATAKPISIY